MTAFVLEYRKKGARQPSPEAVAKLAKALGLEPDDIRVSVKPPEPESRADRFAAAKDKVSDARNEAEQLRDELQEWHDNLPESFQQGTKGDELDEAVSELESFISDCENAEGYEPMFPGMY